MCLIASHAHALKRIEWLEKELEGYRIARPVIPDSDWHPDSTRERPSGRGIANPDSIDWDKLMDALNLPIGSLHVSVADTGSMDGMMDYGHEIILAPFSGEAPYRVEDLQVGDVAAYQPPGGPVSYVGGVVVPTLYLHRIWRIEEDEEGKKYTFWGDNNSKPDPYITRDKHLKYLLVNVTYLGGDSGN